MCEWILGIRTDFEFWHSKAVVSDTGGLAMRWNGRCDSNSCYLLRLIHVSKPTASPAACALAALLVLVAALFPVGVLVPVAALATVATSVARDATAMITIPEAVVNIDCAVVL